MRYLIFRGFAFDISVAPYHRRGALVAMKRVNTIWPHVRPSHSNYSLLMIIPSDSFCYSLLQSTYHGFDLPGVLPPKAWGEVTYNKSP